MTDVVIIALCTAVPATLLGLGTLITSIRNGRKADNLAVKTEQIHTLTNSTMSAVRAELEAAKKEVLGLKALIAEKLKK